MTRPLCRDTAVRQLRNHSLSRLSSGSKDRAELGWIPVVDTTSCCHVGCANRLKRGQRLCRLRNCILQRIAALRNRNLRHSLIADPVSACDEAGHQGVDIVGAAESDECGWKVAHSASSGRSRRVACSLWHATHWPCSASTYPLAIAWNESRSSFSIPMSRPWQSMHAQAVSGALGRAGSWHSVHELFCSWTAVNPDCSDGALTALTERRPPSSFLLINSELCTIGPHRSVGGIVKKKRIAILLKTPLIKEDNDAFESRSDF